MKPKIDPRVRAGLKASGVDAVRSKLLWIMNVRSLDQQDEREEDLGNGIKASRRDMQRWLDEKTAREALWVRVGVIAAVLAAVFSFLALIHL
jgi:hypothetical protein